MGRYDRRQARPRLVGTLQRSETRSTDDALQHKISEDADQESADEQNRDAI